MFVCSIVLVPKGNLFVVLLERYTPYHPPIRKFVKFLLKISLESEPRRCLCVSCVRQVFLSMVTKDSREFVQKVSMFSPICNRIYPLFDFYLDHSFSRGTF